MRTIHALRGAVVSAFVCALAVSPVVAQEKIAGWHIGLEAARSAAMRSGKPIFVVLRCVR
jgi:hypothetical protein